MKSNFNGITEQHRDKQVVYNQLTCPNSFFQFRETGAQEANSTVIMSALPSKKSPLDILEGPHEGHTDSQDSRWTRSLSHSQRHIVFSNTESQT